MLGGGETAPSSDRGAVGKVVRYLCQRSGSQRPNVERMGPRVAVTADRRRDEQVVLLERIGAEVSLFPLLCTVQEDGTALRQATAEICAHPPAYLVANTGYGMMTWFELAGKWGLLERLVKALGQHSAIAARGAKALGELRKVGLNAFYKAPGGTLDEVLKRLLEEDLAAKQVAFQSHGEDPSRLLAPLAAAGARLSHIVVYTMAAASTATAGALARALVEGQLDAVTFTAAPQVRALFEGAGDYEAVLVRAFNEGGVVAACIGPVCAEAARAVGIAAPLVPPAPRLGSLVTALAEHFGVNPKSPSSS
jgi:uroporphyrinogen-III synthase